MLRKSLSVVCVAVILCAGCAKRAAYYTKTASVDESRVQDQDKSTEFDSLPMYSRVRMAGHSTSAAGGGDYGTVFAASRYVAVSHKLEVIEPGAGLAKSIEATVVFCGTIQCEVLSSSVTSEAAGLSPSGNIAARVSPQDLNKFLEFVGKQGKTAKHSTETEDKTSAVIDVDAKIKNQTEFRDSLRKMLVRPGVKVEDLLQIQEKLAEAQAELDSEATQRKVLANETEKVYVEVAFHSEQRTTSRSVFAPIGQALRDSGEVLAESLAALILAIAALIPWLIVIVPGVWVLVRFVGKLRRKRAERKAASLTNSPSQ